MVKFKNLNGFEQIRSLLKFCELTVENTKLTDENNLVEHIFC